MKTICRTFSSVNGVMTSVGTMPVRKSIQEPVCSGRAPSAGVRPVPEPGLVTRPMTRPMATAISDVIMNQRRVRVARRAALLTFRRLVIETRIAKKTSGATASFSRPMKVSPTFSRVVTSQDMSWLRASQPSRTPRTRPASIWAQKGTLRYFGSFGDLAGCVGFAAEDAEDSEDTDMLRRGRHAGRGAGCAELTWERLDEGGTSGATVRGRVPAEVHVQARHEREALRCEGRGCLLHAHDFNTSALRRSKPYFERPGRDPAHRTQSAPVSGEFGSRGVRVRDGRYEVWPWARAASSALSSWPRLASRLAFMRVTRPATCSEARSRSLRSAT